MDRREQLDLISSGRHVKCKFTQEEDNKLVSLVQIYGQNWQKISIEMGNRNVRQCKERYENYLSPNVNRSQFTEEEDRLLLEKYRILGPKWVTIAKLFKGRTDSAIKSRFLLLKRRGIIADYLERGYLETTNKLFRETEPIERRIKRRSESSNVGTENPSERTEGPKKCDSSKGILIGEFDLSIEMLNVEYDLQSFSLGL